MATELADATLITLPSALVTTAPAATREGGHGGLAAADRGAICKPPAGAVAQEIGKAAEAVAKAEAEGKIGERLPLV